MSSFAEIVQTSEEIIKTISTCDSIQEDLLRKSVELWHKKGYFNLLSPKELNDFIFNELISDNIQYNPFLESIFDLYIRSVNLTNNRKVLYPTTDKETQSFITKIGLDMINMDDFKYCIQEIYLNKQINCLDENTKKIIVYLAFVLSSISVGILAKKIIDNNPKNRLSKKNISPFSRKVLVLVVSHQEFETSFNFQRNNFNVLSKNDCKDLYKMTKFLWLGSEEQFYSIGFSKWFNKDNGCGTQESSDYDVRLIKISLKEDRGNFEKGVSNRLPEFKELSENIIEGTVSDRLPPKAYEYPEFYR